MAKPLPKTGILCGEIWPFLLDCLHGYNVTAKYVGTVSKIALDRVRYVAIFEGTEIKPAIPLPDLEDPAVTVPDRTATGGGFHFSWAYVLIPLGAVVLVGGGVGAALYLKKRHESGEESV